jgi:hypothetical protein
MPCGTLNVGEFGDVANGFEQQKAHPIHRRPEKQPESTILRAP